MGNRQPKLFASLDAKLVKEELLLRYLLESVGSGGGVENAYD